MDESLSTIGAITVFIDDVQRSKSFYQDVFGVPVDYEDDNCVIFRFDNTVINLLLSSAAHELIEPAVVASKDAGSRLQFSIFVNDVDAVCAELDKRGVTLLNGPVDRAWGKRTLAFADPDGHVWEIAQDIPPKEA